MNQRIKETRRICCRHRLSFSLSIAIRCRIVLFGHVHFHVQHKRGKITNNNIRKKSLAEQLTQSFRLLNLIHVYQNWFSPTSCNSDPIRWKSFPLRRLNYFIDIKLIWLFIPAIKVLLIDQNMEPIADGNLPSFCKTLKLNWTIFFTLEQVDLIHNHQALLNG